VVANRDSNNATYLANDGAGTFTPMTLSAGLEPRDAAFGDFDADGDLDVAITGHDDRSVTIQTNNGGSFAQSAVLSVGGVVRPEGITSTDLDGDGDADLAVATNDDVQNSATIFLSSGGAFSGPFHYATGAQDTSQIVAADLDCDGDMDLATTNQDSNSISLLSNDGTGAFGAATTMATGTRPGSITAAAMTPNGADGLAVANRDSNDVSVFLNLSCDGGGGNEPCPSDINEDGVVDVSDLLMLLADWGSCDG